ncbi:MAG: TetR/AcrR family transcriptional regulator [Anaerolineae bacterium]|nr:TetR/AcrR family transcriptional regulator [Anaerolineae bacterium]
MAELLKKPDRRIQRTQGLLRDALMELIVEKGYEDISVQDITDRANVARTTFYLHYKDKDELLLTGMAQMYDELVESHMHVSRDELLNDAMAVAMVDKGDFEHVAQFADFYRVMLSNKGSLTFLLGVLRYLETISHNEILKCILPENGAPRLPMGMVANMMAWSEAGAMDWWLREGGEYSAEEMAKMQYYLCMFGLSWVMRLEIPAPDEHFSQE